LKNILEKKIKMLNSKKKLTVILLATLMCLSIVVSVNSVAANPSAPTINVHPGDSIQAAINSAHPGAKIIIHKGTYYDEQLIIDKPLEIKGIKAQLVYEQNPTVPMYIGNLGPLYFAIQIAADGVEISGLKISVANEGYLSAIDASGRTGTVITDNIIDAKRWGISGLNTANVEIENNQITATSPIFYTSPQNIVVRDNVISAQAFVNVITMPPIGIRLAGSFDNGEVRNNEITSDCFGIFIGNLQNNGNIGNWDSGNGITNTVVSDNTVLSSICALYAQKAPGIIIRNNDLTADKLADTTLGPKMWRYGVEIAVQNCAINLAGQFSGGSVINNEIKSIFRGVNVEGPQYIDILRNTLTYIGPKMVATAGISLAYQAVNAQNPYFASANERVEANIINGYGAGVWIQRDGTNNIVTKNTIAAGDLIDNDIGVLIMQNARFNTITYNTISGVTVERGVLDFSQNTDNTIENNTIL
jgi:hypothetical protein